MPHSTLCLLSNLKPTHCRGLALTRMAPMEWLDRQRAGERDQVWHELRQQGDRVRDGAMECEAREVCDEMAHRARYNLEHKSSCPNSGRAISGDGCS